MAETLRDIPEIARQFSCLCQVDSCVHSDLTDAADPRELPFCSQCRHPKCTPCNTYAYGMREAFRWQGRYVYYCPAGLVFVAACTAQEGCFAGGITMGPLLMGDCLDALETITPAHLSFQAARLPDFTSEQVDALSRLLCQSICIEDIAPDDGALQEYPPPLRIAREADVTYKIQEYIREHYSDRLTLDDIAGHVYLSRSYASTLFKAQAGCGIFEYLNAVRVDRACAMLRDTDRSLAEVAQGCGFEDQSYFNRVFKKAMRLSPLQYRKCPIPEEKNRRPEENL